MDKRTDNVLSWDEYFMGLAHLSGLRSKDPNTQVGAVIVDENHRVVSIGYNGFPSGVSDDEFPWGRDGGVLETKYAFVVHAELNAILNSQRSVKGCCIYVSLLKRLFSQVSARLSTNPTNTTGQIQTSLPNVCYVLQV